MASEDALRSKYRELIRCSLASGRIDKSEAKSSAQELEEMLSMEGIKSDSVLHEFDVIYQSSVGACGTKNDANSWLAYAIGLTSAKPEGAFLPARRIFARAGFPDIDADFEFERRQEVYDYIIGAYGRENVGNIGTYQTLKMKSYITRSVKALDLSNSFHLGKEEYVKRNNLLVREIIDSLPEQKGAFLKVFDDEGEEHQVASMSDAFKYCDAFHEKVSKFPKLLSMLRGSRACRLHLACMLQELSYLASLFTASPLLGQQAVVRAAAWTMPLSSPTRILSTSV